MRSKAAIGNHPIHPMIVPVPIGAFFLVLVGDIWHLFTSDPFWYRFSSVAIGVGITFALAAAAVGAIDFMSVPMSRKANAIATGHAASIVAAVALYAVSAILRSGGAGLRTGRWWTGFLLSAAGFLLLALGGWLGGKLAHQERVGVVEPPVTAPRDIDDQPSENPRRAASGVH